ncbi:MAG: glutamine amidotransferase [Aestuariivirgaceae bacterium]|nr:glutamine amidotransferase [Aestuariivirgaceae bacterium]
MTRRILALLHTDVSTTGRIGDMLRARGYAMDIRCPRHGDDLPAHLEDHAGVVIFGGPMSANDPDDYIRRETNFIGTALKAKTPFLGVCLGAQMLAKHLGATVGPHPQGQVEIGYYPLRALDAGEAMGPWPPYVYHWHREGFGLPSGAVHLASREVYENQAIVFHGHAYGIQFHPEVTRATMHRWTTIGRERFSLPNAQDRHDHLEGQLLHDAPVKDWLSRFLDLWLSPKTA